MRVVPLVVIGWVVAVSLACAGAPPAPSGAPSAGVPTSGGKVGKRGRRGATPAPAPGGGGAVVCWAEGIYTNCTRQNGWESCTDSVSRAGGQGASQSEAGTTAVVECNDHMTKMVIIGNYPSGSAEIQQWAQVKQSCRVTGCP